MRPRHWDKLTAELKMDMHFKEDFTLAKGLEMGLMDHLDLISNVADIASKEFAIEMAVSSMEGEWKNLEMQV
jgi:dynein heavy chain